MSKRMLLCCGLLCAAAMAARADDNKPITNAGAQNLVFTFGGLSTLAAAPIQATSAGGTSTNVSIPVYGIGYRYFIANDLALRATLGIVLTSKTTTDSTMTDAVLSQTGFQIGASIEKHMQATSAVSAYFGGLIGYLSGTSKSTFAQPKTVTTEASFRKDAGSDLAIAVYGGAEWFFNSVMSFEAEYQFGLVISTSTVTNSSGGSSANTDGPSSTTIGTNRVGVGLNVYIGR